MRRNTHSYIQKIIPYTLFVASFFYVLSVLPITPYIAHAQEARAPVTDAQPKNVEAVPKQDDAGGSGSANSNTGSPSTGASPDKTSKTKVGAAVDGAIEVIKLPERFLTAVGNAILSVGSALVFFGGKAFETSLSIFVFDMGGYINSPGLGNAIDTMWRLVRDISNLIFIFAFIYIGINLIITPEKVSAKRMLASTIIGALLINFSLFFVKFIIDFANFTSLQIFNALTSGSGSISAKISDMLGFSGLMSIPDADTFDKITSGGMFWFFIMGALMMIIAAFVFFAAAFMLLVRFVALVMIMVASPLLLASIVFPGTQGISSDLWKKLISYAFYAPAFLLVILISITLLEGFGTSIVPGGATLSDALLKREAGSYDTFAVIMNFFIVIFFFIQALHLADKMGLKGADMAVKIGGALTVGLTAKMGRATVGRLAHGISENGKLQAAADAGGVGGWAARQTLSASKAGAHSSFDVRNTKLGGVAGLGAGSSGNYETSHKEQKERDTRNFARTQQTNLNQTIAAGHAAPAGSAGDPARIAMERSIAGASTEQMQKLLKDYDGKPEYDTIVEHMSHSQYENIMKLKPEEYSEEKKEKLKTERTRVIENKRGVVGTTPGGPPATPGTIGQATGAELDAMNFNTVVEHAGHLSMKQIDAMSSLKDSQTAKDTLINARDAALIREFNGPAGVATPASALAFFTRITDENERAKLPPRILTHMRTAQHLNAKVLTKILENDKILSPHRALIKGNVTLIHGVHAFNDFFTTPSGGFY